MTDWFVQNANGEKCEFVHHAGILALAASSPYSSANRACWVPKSSLSVDGGSLDISGCTMRAARLASGTVLALAPRAMNSSRLEVHRLATDMLYQPTIWWR